MFKPLPTPLPDDTSADPTGWRKVFQTLIASINLNTFLVFIATGIFTYLGVDMKDTRDDDATKASSWQTRVSTRAKRTDSLLIDITRRLETIEKK